MVDSGDVVVCTGLYWWTIECITNQSTQEARTERFLRGKHKTVPTFSVELAFVKATKRRTVIVKICPPKKNNNNNNNKQTKEERRKIFLNEGP